MTRTRKILATILSGTFVLPGGCRCDLKRPFHDSVPAEVYKQVASDIEYPNESACTEMNADPSLASPKPWTIDTQGTPEYWDMSLEEAIHLTMANSRVLRDLGGAVVRAPAAVRTTLDPAATETDPRLGIEAALSEFDAQFMTSTFWEKNDRALNNEFFGGGTRLLQQDVGVFQAAITKRAATGTQFTIRHNVDYDANNAPGNRFPSAWNTNVEMEFRHPVLQGGGVQFNRIAGPLSTPGVYTGVLVARLNADVALTDFEIAVRDLVSNVENAYWDLYYGYRVLDSKVKARDAALDTWRKIYALYEVNRRGGEAEKEAQARAQYFLFQQEVQNALSGEPDEGTRNWNGLPSGAFRGTGGVLMAERRLRLLMGLPPTDCKLLRPTDEPIMAKIDFDWCEITGEATTRRAELRRQKWQIRRRELELIASKNFLLPRLDGVGRYRWRGFGDDLFPKGPLPAPPDERFDNAYGNLTSGDFQEWQLGFELNVPIGFREAHVAARNAELLLCRERAILRDQQREVVHEVADAVAELDRAYLVMQTSYNRLTANRDQLGAIQAAYEADKAPLDLYLDAQRRVSEAEVDYHLNRARYSLAAKNVHFVKGTLLEYDGVYLQEGPWPDKAYEDAAKRERSRSVPVPLNYASSLAPVVSMGGFAQNPGEPAALQRPGGEPIPGAQVAPPGSESIPTAPSTPSNAAPTTPPGKSPSTLPGTPPTEEVLPLPKTINGVTPPTSDGSTVGAGPGQPRVVQAPASEALEDKSYRVSDAGDMDASSVAVPSITFRRQSAPETVRRDTSEPPVPLRLPATGP
jgi:outer membrane protein TolC